LTTDQVVHLLGKDKSTLWRWGKEKYLVPVKVGRSNLYKREDVQAILDGKPRY
jgi:predicted DNA-binding transcriptional regulator AlpA